MARFLFIWISYLAVPVAVKNDSMVKIDVVYGLLPERLKADVYKRQEYVCSKIPDHLIRLIEAGGLVEYLKAGM